MKSVLITGANSGIGFATAQRFLGARYRVLAHYHENKQNLERIDNPNLHLFKANLANLEEIEKLFSECVASTSERGVDILVNNAAVYRKEDSIEDIDMIKFDESMQVNLRAPFVLTQRAMQGMRKQKWGRIINISSISIKFGGSTTTGCYTISKAALEAMTLTFNNVGAQSNVLVNAIRVGTTNTTLHEKNPNKNMEQIIENIPAKRMAEAHEVADVIFFLASEESSYISGSIVTVAGGV
jgi:3-oxoacyl-[acyl-carrier protein] reductase